MRALFLGMIYRTESYATISSLSNVGLESASDKFQKNFLEGLENNKVEFDIISSISIGSYPKNYGKLFIKGYYFKNRPKNSYREIGFINFYLIKGISRFLNTLFPFYKWTNNIEKHDEGIVFIYGLYLPNLFLMFLMKKIRPLNISIHYY